MEAIGDAQARYRQQMVDLRLAIGGAIGGGAAVRSRSDAMDTLLRALWRETRRTHPKLATGVSLVAVGGYGRRQLFPFSDVDLLFLLDKSVAEGDLREAIRGFSQLTWDSGARFSPMTRRVSECERFDAENVEFALALLDHRALTGDAIVYARLEERALPRLLRDNGAILARLIEVTEGRHAKYGNTLFHLEPNVKDCLGGLRDVHLQAWVTTLTEARAAGSREGAAGRLSAKVESSAEDREMQEAVEFMTQLRCFLHVEHERDDNVLDWHAQDRSAQRGIGMAAGRVQAAVDVAYWMRLYYRHARTISREAEQLLAERRPVRKRLLAGRLRTGPAIAAEAAQMGIGIADGRLSLRAAKGVEADIATSPQVALGLFAEMARTGMALEPRSGARISAALPELSTHLEEGPALWRGLRAILLGGHAGDALRTMHALGLLDLLVPEFHGIDALVLRDAYHRYTVDEHTFVLIDTLHGLAAATPGGSEWTARFAQLLRELRHPDLLYLAALLHDTGKGRSAGDHAAESARLTEGVLGRLELDSYEAGMVVELVRQHLEMSAALRRDIFAHEAVRAFADKVRTPEVLRMLTLFTYADLNAVHPDALTPWKAENLWRLHMATATHLDRSVDDERVGEREGVLARAITASAPEQRAEAERFLAGFPERYVRTRTPEQIRTHFEMMRRFKEEPVQLDFRYAPTLSEITLVTPDRPRLFAQMAGVLAAWGMNIVTADAFSNRQGVIVDSFRFADVFRTLELNFSERDRFLTSVHEVIAGRMAVEGLLRGRWRARARPVLMAVNTVIMFDASASPQSTLLQVTTRDVPGLLRTLSLGLAAYGCNIEVALVDTEGETAIDVFYLTRAGRKLERAEEEELAGALRAAIEQGDGI